MVKNLPEQLRMVDTPAGSIRYMLRRKKVRRLTLRIDLTGAAVLTVPFSCSDEYADRFILEKSEWLVRSMKKQQDSAAQLLPPVSRDACAEQLRQSLDRVYPLIQPLGVPYPQLKIRKMKTQWGNCHYTQGYITLNSALGRCPEPLRQYVALHELVHFLHHDHGPGFYARMDALMPDWRQRRTALRGYSQALLD